MRKLAGVLGLVAVVAACTAAVATPRGVMSITAAQEVVVTLVCDVEAPAVRCDVEARQTAPADSILAPWQSIAVGDSVVLVPHTCTGTETVSARARSVGYTASGRSGDTLTVTGSVTCDPRAPTPRSALRIILRDTE